jgi:ribosomal protein S24E
MRTLSNQSASLRWRGGHFSSHGNEGVYRNTENKYHFEKKYILTPEAN